MTLTDVRDASFHDEVLASEVPVLVDFWAAWCAPCRVMHPVLQGMADDRDDLRIVRVDVESELQVASDYGVLAMPTFILFRDGEPVLRLLGARPRKRLERELAEVL